MEILTAVLILAALGLLAGLILAVASILMAVPKDEKAEALCELLPGANCGACGYSGCAGYADAMANHGAKVGLCSPGGEAVAKATGEILGVSGEVTRNTALVRCGGCEEFTARKLEYHGLPSCRAATQFCATMVALVTATAWLLANTVPFRWKTGSRVWMLPCVADVPNAFLLARKTSS